MIIEKIVVEDFRQFRGKQELIFSTLKGKNVTVVHAENGFGKTALLNALLWGFYGHEGLTEDFEHPDSILHEDVARKSRDANATEARVTILFRDDESRYSLTRSLSLAQQKLNAKQTILHLKVTRDGETFTEESPQRRIDTLMPRGIRDFLFFNGERIDHLAMAQNSELITQAIYQVLGLNLLRTTAADLRHPSVRGELNRRLREHSDQDARALIDKHAASEAEVARIKESIETCANERKAVEGEIRTIDAKLETNKEAHALQTERRGLEERQSSQNTALQELDIRIAQTIAADAYGVFAKGLVTRGKEIVQRLRSEGKIPARVLNSFLHELLEAHRCICGTGLPEGSDQFKEVQKLLTIAGDQNFNNAVGALDNAIGVIEGGVDRTISTLQNQRAQRVQLRQELRRLGERLEEIHEKLGSKDDDAVTALETKRQDLQLKLREHDTSFGSLQEQLKAAEKVRDDLLKQVHEVKLKEGTAILAQRQLEAADEAAAILDRLLELEMSDLREVLNREIDSHFQKIIDREYWAELSDQFVLRIKKRCYRRCTEHWPAPGYVTRFYRQPGIARAPAGRASHDPERAGWR
jgi:DNA sulfur modification protein DndD